MLPSACRFIVMFHCLTFSCRCSTLHVSAYKAIFRYVWCFTFIFLKESASLFLLNFLVRGYTLHVSICVFFVNFLVLVRVLAFSCCLSALCCYSTLSHGAVHSTAAQRFTLRVICYHTLRSINYASRQAAPRSAFPPTPCNWNWYKAFFFSPPPNFIVTSCHRLTYNSFLLYL
jgi:hypothetical protein